MASWDNLPGHGGAWGAGEGALGGCWGFLGGNVKGQGCRTSSLKANRAPKKGPHAEHIFKTICRSETIISATYGNSQGNLMVVEVRMVRLRAQTRHREVPREDKQSLERS